MGYEDAEGEDTMVNNEMKKKNQVLGSRRHSIACSPFHSFLMDMVIPVPEADTLSSAHFFSSGVKNLAVAMVSGRKNKTTKPHIVVADPNT